MPTVNAILRTVIRDFSLISASISARWSSVRDFESRPDPFSSSSIVLLRLNVSNHSYTFPRSSVHIISLTFCYKFRMFQSLLPEEKKN